MLANLYCTHRHFSSGLQGLSLEEGVSAPVSLLIDTAKCCAAFLCVFMGIETHFLMSTTLQEKGDRCMFCFLSHGAQVRGRSSPAGPHKESDPMQGRGWGGGKAPHTHTQLE